MTTSSGQSTVIQQWLDRLQAGDEAARAELIRSACGRLERLTGLSQSEAAPLLGVSERTVKRRWAAARLQLHDLLGGTLPGWGDATGHISDHLDPIESSS